MANLARIDENNIVDWVIVGNDDDPNGDGGIQWAIDGLGGNWVLADNEAGELIAGISFIYDPETKTFSYPETIE